MAFVNVSSPYDNKLMSVTSALYCSTEQQYTKIYYYNLYYVAPANVGHCWLLITTKANTVIQLPSVILWNAKKPSSKKQTESTVSAQNYMLYTSIPL